MLEFIAGAAVFAGGMAVGRVARVRSGPRSKKLPQPVCGCEHELAYHDPKTGECHATITVVIEKGQPILDPFGEYVVTYKAAKYEARQCTCRRYTGPEPLSSYYAPELLP